MNMKLTSSSEKNSHFSNLQQKLASKSGQTAQEPCGSTFSEESDSIFEDAFPFQCNYCPNAYSTNFQRILHQQRGHYFTGRPYKCNLSTRRFGLQSRDETNMMNWESSESESSTGSSSESVSSLSSSCETSSGISTTNSGSKSNDKRADQGRIKEWNQQQQLTQKLTVTVRKHRQHRPHVSLVKSRKMRLIRYNCKASKTKVRRRPPLPFQCSYCSKPFSRNVTRKDHENTHTGHRPYKCKNCTKSYAHRGSISRHRRQCGINEEEVLLVQHQHQKIEDQHLIIRSLGSTGRTSYICKFCKKNLGLSSIARIHIRNHIGLKPFECVYCTKGFVSITQLKKHERGHTKTRRSL